MRRLVWGALGVFAALLVAGALLDALAAHGSAAIRDLDVDPPAAAALSGLTAAITPVVGALIAHRQPRNPIGWRR